MEQAKDDLKDYRTIYAPQWRRTHSEIDKYFPYR